VVEFYACPLPLLVLGGNSNQLVTVAHYSSTPTGLFYVEGLTLGLSVIHGIVESSDIWQLIPKVTTPFSLAAFALGILYLILTRYRRKTVPLAAWVTLVLIVLIPLGLSAYSEIQSRATIYRLRVTVVDPQNVPIEDAKVWSSFGGEAKKVAGGWEFDIPRASKPVDGKLTLFASKESSFLTGRADITLDNDYSPVIAIKLSRDDSAKVRGQVMDSDNHALSGARVFVVGFEADAVVTKEGGNFELPAHAAVNQQVLLHAERKGYQTTKLWHPAGDAPALLVLDK